MAGVVYGASTAGGLGKYGRVIAMTSGAVIPPGQYFSSVTWNAMIDGVPAAMPPGYVDSDGTATMGAAGNLMAIGDGLPMLPWPWRPPWPLPGSGA